MKDMKEKIIERLERGEAAEAIAADLGLDISTDHDGAWCDTPAVLLPGYRADDGNAEVVYVDAASGEEAAQEYVDTGEWGDDRERETIWIRVETWRAGLAVDEDGDVIEVRAEEESHEIELDPEEPECSHDEGHDWQTPYELLGGLRENPGCWGHGAGIVQHEVCMRCGCGRTTDTWAQDPNTGAQGLEAVKYAPGKFADEVRAMRKAIRSEALAEALAELWEHLDDADWVVVCSGDEYEVTPRAHARGPIVCDAANNGQWGDDALDAYENGEAWATDIMGAFGDELLEEV